MTAENGGACMIGLPLVGSLLTCLTEMVCSLADYPNESNSTDRLK